MTRAVRLSAALLLAGLGLAAQPGIVLAQNRAWQFVSETDPLTDTPIGSVVSTHSNGGYIAFRCVRGEKIENFLAKAATRTDDRYLPERAEVAWRIDKGTVQNEFWETHLARNDGGVITTGKKALEFARAVGRAQNRIVLRNPNGTAVFDAKGSTNAINQMLKLCGLG